ncbi:alkaline phosphatase family protein [Nannocystaceae bacterium ST9]
MPTTAEINELLPDVHALVQLAFDKAAAHLQSPARYPLPSGGVSVEQALANKLERLPSAIRRSLSSAALGRLASSSTRTLAYGRMAALDPASAAPLLERAAALPTRESLRRRSIDASVRPESTPLRPPSLGTIVPKQIDLSVAKVFCKDKVSTALRDEIHMALTLHDVYHGEDHQAGPFAVGKFRAGESIEVDRLLASAPALDGIVSELIYPVTLYMAEKDIAGGFAEFIHDAQALSNHEMLELLSIANALSTTALLGFADAASSEFSVEGLHAAIARGLLGTIGIQAGPFRAIGRVLALALADGLRERLRDDCFSPTMGVLTVPARPEGPLTVNETVTLTMLEGGPAPAPEPIAEYAVDLRWTIQTTRTQAEPPPPRPPTETSDALLAHANLQKIDHVIVLMLENRSFDQMLGYLSLESGRAEVEGLLAPTDPRMRNRLAGEQEFSIAPLTSTSFAPDPGHNFERVTRQMWGKDEASKAIAANEGKPDHLFQQPPAELIDMSGFIDDFHRVVVNTLPAGEQVAAAASIMGYHQAEHVPAFHLLASEFAVCNRWFSAFPGNTWVNRTIALTGKVGRRADGTPITDNAMPLDEQAFVRTLDAKQVDWAFYSQDVPSLLMVDASHADRLDRLRSVHRFFADAKNDTLPAVSWIDPNFMDLGPINEDLKRFRQNLGELDGSSFVSLDSANDDHPPGDVAHGQFLVFEVFRQLFASPAWRRSLLLITYDEHGGFFDHVAPPKCANPEAPVFEFLGMRVPALVVSPWVGRKLAANTQFDHTSIIRTILERFCRDPKLAVTDPKGIPDLGPRVAAAKHLGHLLTEPEPRMQLGPVGVEGQRRAKTQARAVEAALRLRVGVDDRRWQGKTKPVNDLQAQINAGRQAILARMKPPTKP